MHMRHCLAVLAMFGCLAASPAGAQSTWVGAPGGDYFDPNNWNPVGLPVGLATVNAGSTEANPIILNGTTTLDGFALGVAGTDAGHISMTGGTVTLDTFEDTKTWTGDGSSELSTFTMSGGAQIDMGQIGTGTFNSDWEVGENGPGKLTITGDGTRLRINDDLKIGASGGGNGEVHLGIPGGTDAPEINIGSGTSVGAGMFILSANSLFVSGNDSGLYAAGGVQDEGYLTFGEGSVDDPAVMIIQDNARAYVRTLQNRGDAATLTIKDNGELHIQETLAAGAGGTVTSDGKDSHWGRDNWAGGERLITLQDNAIFTIDTNFSGVPDSGLSLGGGENGSAGGEARLFVRDSATLDIVQGLQVGNGSAPTSNATLQIRGGNATVEMDGDLSFAFDAPSLSDSAGTGTLFAQFDGATHTSVQVGGLVYLGFGSELELEAVGSLGLPGTYFRTLIDGTIETGFSFGAFGTVPAVDTNIGSGVTFKGITYNANSIVVELLQASILVGDGNGDGWVDGLDYLIWAANFGGPPTPPGAAGGDYDGNGTVDGLDYLEWAANFGTHTPSTAVPEPGSLALLCLALASLLVTRRRRR